MHFVRSEDVDVRQSIFGGFTPTASNRAGAAKILSFFIKTGKLCGVTNSNLFSRLDIILQLLVL